MAGEINPYQAPRARIAAPADDGVDLQQVMSGQKLVLFSILMLFAAMLLPIVRAPGFPLGLVAIALSIWSSVRVAGGLGLSLLMKIVLVLVMFVPLVNLVTLMILNLRASRVLRDAGCRISPLGLPR